MKMYAAIGNSKDSIKEVSVGCGQTVSLPAMQSTYINFILPKAKEDVTVKVKPDPGTSSSSKLAIIIGSVVGGLVIVGLGTYCFIKKRNQNLYEKLNGNSER